MTETSLLSTSFADRLLPAPVAGGFRLNDHWVWGGSVVRGEDGRYHLFVSVWPKALPFFDGYITNSRVVRAVSDTPAGPYRLEQEILPPRDPAFWDGRMTHNPEIRRIGNQYFLFYIGSTYPGPIPSAHDASSRALDRNAIWRRIRIGVATAPTVQGPWHRPDAPTFEPRPGQWDSLMVTNPTGCVAPDGRILMLYRSSSEGSFAQLGAALADHPHGPYRRAQDGPILAQLLKNESALEDPFLWYNGREFELIAKDLTGTVCGELNAGVHAISENGLDWELAPNPRAYSRTVRWDDGTVTEQGCFERPKLLIENGAPTHLFAATGDGPGGFEHCTKTWCMVTPLRTPPR
jgi:hypothetical protein